MGGGGDYKHSSWFRFGNFVLSRLKEGFTIDDLIKGNENFLKTYFSPLLAKTLHTTFLYFLGHLYIGYALARPLIDRLKQQHGVYKLKESVNLLRSEVTLFLIAIAAFFHVWSILPIMQYFNWVFTLRPQINVKPQMTVLTQRSKSVISLPSMKEVNDPLKTLKSSRSKSANDVKECYSPESTSVDLNWDIKVRDGVMDKIWSKMERVSETASLASGLHNSMFSLSFGTSTVSSDISEYAFYPEELNKAWVYDVTTDNENDLTDDSLLPYNVREIESGDEDYYTAPECSYSEC